MPQTLIYQAGGTIETTFARTRPATCTVTLYTGQGGVKVNGVSATVDTVSTSVSTAIAAGAAGATLASASGVVSGRSYILGTEASTAPLEVVTVKSLSGSTAAFFAPVLYTHNSGDRFSCGRVTYAVSSTSADALWWDGYAIFTPDSGDAQVEVVDCTLRKIPDQLVDVQTLLQVFPHGIAMLESGLDLPRALTEARDQYLQLLGGRVRTMTMLGASDFRYGAALQFWLLRRHAFGAEWAADMDRIAADLDAEVKKLRSMVPVDADQDGSTQGPFDGGFTSGRLERG